MHKTNKITHYRTMPLRNWQKATSSVVCTSGLMCVALIWVQLCNVFNKEHPPSHATNSFMKSDHLGPSDISGHGST